MSTTILIKRGLEANRLSVTPLAGEFLWTTDNNDLWVGDGATAGGIKVTGNVENTNTLTNYYTKTASDARYVELAGDTMTGPLVLNANPTLALGAATKQYVDGLIDSGMKTPDGFPTDAGGNYPTDYKGSGAVHAGDTFYITSVALGTTVGVSTVNAGDLLVALVDAPGNTDSNWTIVESNRSQATETIKGVAQIATQAEVDAGIDDTKFVTPSKLAAATSVSVEAIQDAAGAMFTGNAENGIVSTYNDVTNKVDLDVNDFDITLTGATTGTGTVTNLSNVSFATAIPSIKNIDDVFTTMTPADGHVLMWDNANSRWDAGAIPSGVTNFVGLSDTPANFTGGSGKLVAVNAGETALEYIDTIDGGTF